MCWAKPYEAKARLSDKALQGKIDGQNKSNKSQAKIEVYSRYKGRDGPWFVVEVPGKVLAVFHGLEQLESALDIAQALDKAYDKGAMDERRRVMGVVATP